jgi:hypothetical protein
MSIQAGQLPVMSLAASSELIAKPQQTTIYHSEMGQESSSSGVYKRCAK